MEWWLVILWLFGGSMLLMLTGLPVAFSFLLADFVAMYYFIGASAPQQLIGSIFDSLTKFSLTAIPLFVLMGEVLFSAGLARRVLDVVDKWLGRLPGRLGVLTIIAGAIFASLSGSAMANTALLGSLLLPDMVKRKYDPKLVVGTIMASGSLAMMIPPSTLTVIFGSVAMVPVGDLLVAGIVPGLLVAGIYIAYTVGACLINPRLAPAEEVESRATGSRLLGTLKDVVPLAAIIFVTIGVIILGVATPTEAAAMGALASLLLALAYGELNVTMVKKAATNTLRVSAMLLIIVAGSNGFSQVLAYTGASRGLMEAVLGLSLPPLLVVVGMMVIVFFLGMFMEEISIIMITVPVFMPVINALGINPVWFGILMLLMMEQSLMSPPVGMLLYVVKGMTPKGVTMADIWISTIPYMLCIAVAIALILFFPSISLYLVNVSH